MLNSWKLLLQSRKFWVGTITVLAVFASVYLRAAGKIPADALIPTIAAITSTALGLIGGIAWEDVANKDSAARKGSEVAKAELLGKGLEAFSGALDAARNPPVFVSDPPTSSGGEDPH